MVKKFVQKNTKTKKDIHLVVKISKMLFNNLILFDIYPFDQIKRFSSLFFGFDEDQATFERLFSGAVSFKHLL